MLDFFALMRAELLVTLILFILLFLKIRDKEWKSDSLLNLINILLVINLAIGFFPIREGTLFADMFRTK